MKTTSKKSSIKEFKFYDLDFYDQESNTIQDYDFEKLFCKDSMSNFVEIGKHVFFLYESYCTNCQITGVIHKIDKKTFNKNKEFIQEHFQIAENFVKENSIKKIYFVFDFSKGNHLALETTNKVMRANEFIYFFENIFPNIGIDKHRLIINNMAYLKDNILAITEVTFKIKKESLNCFRVIDSNLWETLNIVFNTLNCSEFCFSSNVTSAKLERLNHKSIEALIAYIIQNPKFVNNFEKFKICFLNKNTNMIEYFNFFGKTNLTQIINYNVELDDYSFTEQIENQLNCYIESL